MKRRKRDAQRTNQARILARRLRRYVGMDVDVTVTNNRSTMVAVRRRPDILRARVHHMFTDAPSNVVRALAGYIARADRRDSALIGGYIEGNQRRIRSQRPVRRAVLLCTRGRAHDLREIFEDLNHRYFDGRIKAAITWGPRIRGQRTSIKFGSYSVEDCLIRVHPALDQTWVPRWFVAWIVYHEMLHQIYDIPRVAGRRRFHTPEFLAHERRFPHHERAQRWQRANLDRLLAA